MKSIRHVFVAASLSLLMASVSAVAAEGSLYRIELDGNLVLLAKTPPVPHGTRLVFARHPDGVTVSLKRADVRRVVTVPIQRVAGREFKPGELLVLGPTGEGASGATSSAGATPSTGAQGMRPGESPGGKALLNPQREYRPDWDARQVPGATLPYPASPGDYREGLSFAYPPGNAVQASPGQPPTGVPSGEPPRMPP